MANEGANKWAVLIGVDYYISGASRPEVPFRHLKGCVEDVNLVCEYLRESLGVQDSHIYRLTATSPNDDSGVPKEDPSKWPTYENIVGTLQKVSREAKPRDLVYLHYSGHGIRAKTIFGDLKGDDALDEALVTTDIACGGRYIRDVELAYLLQDMVKKELIVTVVLDCCHSGGADRSRDYTLDAPKVRGIGTIDKNTLDSDISEFHGELEIAMRKHAHDVGRSASVANHWLLESHGYAIFAACRAHESALERNRGGRMQGLLTYSLIDTLKNNSQMLTYHKLWELIAPKVRDQSSTKQNVVLGGEGDRLFYSGDHLDPFHVAAVTVIKVDVTGGRTTARLNAGKVHGISSGTEFDVWSASCSDFSDSERLGRLRVTIAEVVTAEAKLVEQFTPSQQLKVGCLALPRTAVTLRRPVRLLYPESPGEDDLTEKSLDAAREAWKRHGTTFAPLIDGSEGGETFQVQVKNGAYEILGAEGQPLQHKVLPLPVDAERAAEKLVRRLIHLAKYRNVLDLKSPSNQPGLSVSLDKKPYSFPLKPRLVNDPPSTPSTNQRREASADEWLLLQVVNTSKFVLNITVLDMDSSWAIEQIYPSRGAAYEVLDPGKTLYLPLNVIVPDGAVRPGVLDTIKVIATVEPTSFWWLQLAELDGKTLQRGGAPNRGNALERLQAAMMLWEPRSTKVVVCIPLRWYVEHVTIEVGDVS